MRELSGDTGEFSARRIEKILRDGGCSKRLAREIVAHGYRAATQDTGLDPEAVATKLHAAAELLRKRTDGCSSKSD